MNQNERHEANKSRQNETNLPKGYMQIKMDSQVKLQKSNQQTQIRAILRNKNPKQSNRTKR